MRVVNHFDQEISENDKTIITYVIWISIVSVPSHGCFSLLVLNFLWNFHSTSLSARHLSKILLSWSITYRSNSFGGTEMSLSGPIPRLFLLCLYRTWLLNTMIGHLKTTKKYKYTRHRAKRRYNNQEALASLWSVRKTALSALFPTLSVSQSSKKLFHSTVEPPKKESSI